MRRSLERVQPWPARIDAPSRALLTREVARAFRAGELAAVGPIRRTPSGYAVEVLRLRDRRVAPAWRKPAIVAGSSVLVLGTAAAIGWWLVGATAVAAGTVPLSLIIGGAAVLLVVVASARRGGRPGCVTTVTITHRCR